MITWMSMWYDRVAAAVSGTSWRGLRCVGSSLAAASGSSWRGLRCVGSSLAAASGSSWRGLRCVGSSLAAATALLETSDEGGGLRQVASK